MNRRALLSRLPLLAALPWLARRVLAETSPVALTKEPRGRVTIHYTAGDPPRRATDVKPVYADGRHAGRWATFSVREDAAGLTVVCERVE